MKKVDRFRFGKNLLIINTEIVIIEITKKITGSNVIVFFDLVILFLSEKKSWKNSEKGDKLKR